MPRAALALTVDRGLTSSAARRARGSATLPQWFWKFYDAVIVMLLAVFGAAIVFTLTAAVVHNRWRNTCLWTANAGTLVVLVVGSDCP
jgi:hypothetical protein